MAFQLISFEWNPALISMEAGVAFELSYTEPKSWVPADFAEMVLKGKLVSAAKFAEMFGTEFPPWPAETKEAHSLDLTMQKSTTTVPSDRESQSTEAPAEFFMEYGLEMLGTEGRGNDYLETLIAKRKAKPSQQP